MSLNQLSAHRGGRAERSGVPTDNLQKVMHGESANIAARGVRGAEKNLADALDDFDRSSTTLFAAADKLHASSDELTRRIKASVSRAKDASAQMADCMGRITKLLGTDFESRLTQMERLADAMERLSALQKNGQLANVISAMSK